MRPYDYFDIGIEIIADNRDRQSRKTADKQNQKKNSQSNNLLDVGGGSMPDAVGGGLLGVGDANNKKNVDITRGAAAVECMGTDQTSKGASQVGEYQFEKAGFKRGYSYFTKETEQTGVKKEEQEEGIWYTAPLCWLEDKEKEFLITPNGTKKPYLQKKEVKKKINGKSKKITERYFQIGYPEQIGATPSWAQPMVAFDEEFLGQIGPSRLGKDTDCSWQCFDDDRAVGSMRDIMKLEPVQSKDTQTKKSSEFNFPEPRIVMLEFGESPDLGGWGYASFAYNEIAALAFNSRKTLNINIVPPSIEEKTDAKGNKYPVYKEGRTEYNESFQTIPGVISYGRACTNPSHKILGRDNVHAAHLPSRANWIYEESPQDSSGSLYDGPLYFQKEDYPKEVGGGTRAVKVELKFDADETPRSWKWVSYQDKAKESKPATPSKPFTPPQFNGPESYLYDDPGQIHSGNPQNPAWNRGGGGGRALDGKVPFNPGRRINNGGQRWSGAYDPPITFGGGQPSSGPNIGGIDEVSNESEEKRAGKKKNPNRGNEKDQPKAIEEEKYKPYDPFDEYEKWRKKQAASGRGLSAHSPCLRGGLGSGGMVSRQAKVGSVPTISQRNGGVGSAGPSVKGWSDMVSNFLGSKDIGPKIAASNRAQQKRSKGNNARPPSGSVSATKPGAKKGRARGRGLSRPATGIVEQATSSFHTVATPSGYNASTDRGGNPMYGGIYTPFVEGGDHFSLSHQMATDVTVRGVTNAMKAAGYTSKQIKTIRRNIYPVISSSMQGYSDESENGKLSATEIPGFGYLFPVSNGGIFFSPSDCSVQDVNGKGDFTSTFLIHPTRGVLSFGLPNQDSKCDIKIDSNDKTVIDHSGGIKLSRSNIATGDTGDLGELYIEVDGNVKMSV